MASRVVVPADEGSEVEETVVEEVVRDYWQHCARDFIHQTKAWGGPKRVCKESRVNSPNIRVYYWHW